MRVPLVVGAIVLLACGGSGGNGGSGPTGPSGDADIAGVWAFSAQAQTTSGIPETCAFSGALFLNQTRSMAAGTIDGPISCEGVEEFTQQVEGPVENVQVNGDNISWSQDDCQVTGEVRTVDRIDGDLSCTTMYLGTPVTIRGVWQMSR